MFPRIRTGAAALLALGAIAVGAAAIANAASGGGGTTGAQGPTGTQGVAPDARQGAPPTSGHGPGEALLTDGAASKVRQAALGKVPGATVLRVETDAQGSPYEAHLQKSDGSLTTVKVNKQFQATAVQSGFGAGAPGAGGPPPGSTP